MKTDNIYFIGLMGAGKTTIGKLIAKLNGATFYDSDHEIEVRTGVKIPLIFELEGEAGFRKREKTAIEELCQLNHIVLATGGGAVLQAENRALLKQHGIVIYLRAQVHDLWIRTRFDKTRPLLQGGDLREKLDTLYTARDPIYTELADYIIDTGKQSANEITQQIDALIKQTLLNTNTWWLIHFVTYSLSYISI